MNQMITEQLLLFMTSIQIGVCMGVLFDLIRIFRKLIKHPNFFVQIEDMLYWIACGFVGFYMLYICNYAEIRPYIFIGIVLGGIFYFATFSIIFMKIATIVIFYIKSLIGKLIQLILIPIRGAIRMVKIPLRYIMKQWVYFRVSCKIKYRKMKRKKYEQKSDRKVEKYLKKEKLDLPERKA